MSCACISARALSSASNSSCKFLRERSSSSSCASTSMLHLDAEFPVHLALLRGASPRLHGVLDPSVVHDLEHLSLELEQQRFRVHFALGAVADEVRRLLREVLVKRRARGFDELADVVPNRSLVSGDGHDRVRHPRHAVLVSYRLIQHLIRVRHDATRGEAILEPRVRHHDLPVDRRLLVVPPLLVRRHDVRAVRGVSLAHARAEHLQLVPNRVRVRRGVVHHRGGDALEVHEHLLHPGEVFRARVLVRGAVEELRGVEVVPGARVRVRGGVAGVDAARAGGARRAWTGGGGSEAARDGRRASAAGGGGFESQSHRARGDDRGGGRRDAHLCGVG
eukprot:31342-Pelagococcus_subviridis.AAC.26